MNVKPKASAIWRMLLIASLLVSYAIVIPGLIGTIPPNVVSVATLVGGLLACMAMIGYFITAEIELRRIWR